MTCLRCGGYASTVSDFFSACIKCKFEWGTDEWGRTSYWTNKGILKDVPDHALFVASWEEETC
jgi:hypothetical protein